MAPISLVLFDMDDVLCAYSRPTRAAHLARHADLDPERVLEAIWGSGLEAEADAGTLDAEAYLRACGERLGFPLTLDQWLDARGAAMTPRPEVLQIVERVRRRARTGLLTNNTTLVGRYADRLFPELRPLFGDAIWTSAALKAAKPEPECYRRCLDELGAVPAETLFIDDLAANVAGAQSIGISAHQYRSAGELARFLASHGVLPPDVTPGASG